MERITIRQPFDSHVHFRDGAMMETVAPFTAKQCWGAVIMPNLAPAPIKIAGDAWEYEKRIRSVIGGHFTTVMTGYLTDKTNPKDVVEGFEEGLWQAMKYYPKGATTNSDEGLTDIGQLCEVFSEMERIGMPLLLHGEVNIDQDGNDTDPYDREQIFIDEVLSEIIVGFPHLKISQEHISTRKAVEFILEHGSENLVCTATFQHLMYDRRKFFEGGVNPHLHCWPVLKRWQDTEALRALATAGQPFISAGTDSAPHPTHAKERACGCAGGVFTAHAMTELYTQVFDEEGSLGNLENFLSVNGPRFFGLEPSKDTIELKKKPWTVDSMIDVRGGEQVRPLFFHEDREERTPIQWRIDN